MKSKILLAFFGAVMSAASVGWTCIPTISKSVTYSVLNPGVRVLTAEAAGGGQHTTVYIEILVNKGDSQSLGLNFDKTRFHLVSEKKTTNGVKYVLQVKGSGKSLIEVLRNGLAKEKQAVETKVLPTPKSC